MISVCDLNEMFYELCACWKQTLAGSFWQREDDDGLLKVISVEAYLVVRFICFCDVVFAVMNWKKGWKSSKKEQNFHFESGWVNAIWNGIPVILFFNITSIRWKRRANAVEIFSFAVLFCYSAKFIYFYLKYISLQYLMKHKRVFSLPALFLLVSFSISMLSFCFRECLCVLTIALCRVNSSVYNFCVNV